MTACNRTPAQIQRFLDENLHRFDLPAQFLGDEPNAVCKSWHDATVRWCLVASWPYEAAAGNQSVPAVYKAINDGHPNYLADRFYLPATPRDLGLLAKNTIPIFGIESKRQLSDFDCVGTSIAYPILAMSYVKMLRMSGIPIRWLHRGDMPSLYPMVVVGGQGYGAPETLAPVVDCWWLGEVEDEPGNPGITAVNDRIAAFKTSERWQLDRIGCYEDLAREFDFLYFPRFVRVHYRYEDRSHVGVGPELSKQVAGYTSTVEGMRLPFKRRIVKDLDKAKPLVDPPLLYADPAMGSGDLEVARGCPAWCSFCALCLGGETEFITKNGVRRLDGAVGCTQEVWTAQGWGKAEIAQHGEDVLNTITFAPAHLGWSEYAKKLVWKRNRGDFTVTHRATARHRWPLVDGSETHDLRPGDFVRAEFVRAEGEDFNLGWLHGLTFGDGCRENSHLGERSSTYAALVRAAQADHLARFAAYQCDSPRDHARCERPVCVVSITRVSDQLYRVRMNTKLNFKDLPRYTTTRSSSYFGGFIAGWDAADGNTRSRHEHRLRINSQHPEAEAWLRRCAAYGGWVLTGVYERTSRETNFGTRRHPLKEYSLSRVTAWKVVSIERGSEPEPVYCATVPGVGFWTLATGVYTGNTYRQKPYRERSVDNVVAYAKSFADNMGSVRMAPFSPDFPMYVQKKKLVGALLEKVSDEVDAPTMRVDDFIADNDFMLLQVAGGMDSVTLGVEGNSQRMRDLVGKGTSDADICEAVTRGIRAGIRKFKLYMITNLPGEDEGDVVRILKLAKALADIRESMGQPNVQIQFSWTPLSIEANTPLQWFAPSPASRILGDIWEELRDLKIGFKIGAKSEQNKIAFFQLAQRASRDVGEALVDAMEQIDQACWGTGGVPRDFRDTLDTALRRHGFRNGFGDCFDERFKDDLFGWEMIDQGISTELLWITYLQMREFIEQTDSHTYDLNFDAGYHGNEWIERCDTKCHGKTCGACDYDDLKIRKRYLSRTDADTQTATLTVVDQRTQAMRVRARIFKPERYRFVGNDHYRFAIRRAAFRAQTALGVEHGITKRSIRFASDAVKYRDWTCGVDYVEFGLTRRLAFDEVRTFLNTMDGELRPWLSIGGWTQHPATAKTMRADVDLTLFELEIDVDPAIVLARLAAWHAADHIPMRLKIQAGYFAPASEEVNARDYVDDLWLVRDGHRLKLRMLVRGRPSPYNVYAALMRRSSWLEAAKLAAVRLDAFIDVDRTQQDFFRPTCMSCGLQIPTNVLDQPYDPQYCPRCHDEQHGRTVKELNP